MKCDKCGDNKFKSKSGLSNHIKKCNGIKKNINHICPKCNFYIKSAIEKHVNYCTGDGPRRSKPKSKLSTTEQFSLLAKKRWSDPEYRKKVIEKLKNTIRKPISIETEKNRRKKISDFAKSHGYGGYIKGSGRGKSGWYKDYWCDSSWELAFVIYNLDHNISFDRNKEKFEYFWNDKIYNWIPDFIIDNIYYEIKGYWTEQNQSKFNSFKKPLKILYKKDIDYMINYVIDKYGKNYTKLYENNKTKSCSLCDGYICKKNNNGICQKCLMDTGILKEHLIQCNIIKNNKISKQYIVT